MLFAMLDLKAIREDPEAFRPGLSRRGAADSLDRLLALDEQVRGLKVRVEDLRAEQNRASKAVGSAAPEERQPLMESLHEVSKGLKELDPRLQDAQDELDALMARLPNVPHESVPDGESDEDNVELRRVGDVPSFGFDSRDHLELGEAAGVIDVERAARTSGSRFAYLLGPSGQAFLKQDGFDLITPPKVTGSGIPATVQSALP